MFKQKKAHIQDYINFLGFALLGYLLGSNSQQWMIYVTLFLMLEMLVVNTIFIFRFKDKQQIEEGQEE